MKLKLFLCLMLAVGGSCHAAIILPKAPDGGKEVAAKYLDPETLRGLRITNTGPLTIGDPVGSYGSGYLGAGKLLLSPARLGSWQYPIMDGTNAVGSVQLDTSNHWDWTGTPVFANEMLVAIRMAEDMPSVKKGDYEPRFLYNPQVSFGAVWLHGQTNDIIIPLPETYGRMNAYQPYSESQIIAILKPEARRARIMYAKLHKQEQHDYHAYAKAMTDYEKAQGGKCGTIALYGMGPIQNVSLNVFIITLLGTSDQCGRVGYRAKVTFEHYLDNVQKVEILGKLTAAEVNKMP